MTARKSLIAALVILAVLALVPVDLSATGLPYPGLRRYGTYILTLWLVTAIAAMGVNLIVGYAGQETLAQAAFVGIGAYLTAIAGQHGQYHESRDQGFARRHTARSSRRPSRPCGRNRMISTSRISGMAWR